MDVIMFAVTDCIGMSCSLGRQCKPGFSLSFLDIYGCHNVCSDYWHNYFLQPGQAVLTIAQTIFFRCLWVPSFFSVTRGATISLSLCRQYRPVISISFLYIYGCHNVWHNYFLQPGKAVLASAHSFFLLITMGAIIFVVATITTI